MYLRGRSFDVSTAEGRQKERYRLVLFAILTNAFSTGLSMVAFLITVPLTLPYLGEERFGVWMTISSIAVLLSFLDLGVGNSLINRVAAAKTSQDKDELGFVVVHGLGLLFLMGSTLGAALFISVDLLPWTEVIKLTKTENSAEVGYALQAFFVIFAISIPITAIPKIFQGLQIAWIAHLVRAIGSAVSVVSVYFLAAGQAAVPELLIATYGIQTLAPVFLLAVLIKKRVLTINALKGRNFFSESTGILKDGGLFFLLQVAGVIVWGIDTIIVSTTLGASSVTTLALVQRVFQFVLVPLAIVNSPLWGAYADANVRGDKAFILRTLKRSIIGTTLAALLACMLIAIAAPFIFDFWIGTSDSVPLLLIWSYGALVFVMAAGNSFAMFLNGVGEIKSQVFTVCLFCAISIPLKLHVIGYFGIPGLILTSIAAYFIAVLLPYVTIFRGRLKRYLA